MKEYKEYRVKIFDNRTEWYNLLDELHREDGPAIEHTNGDKYWYLNGQLHRENGPAVEFANGDKYWYLNGKKYTEEEFLKKIGQSCTGKIVEFEGKRYRLEEI